MRYRNSKVQSLFSALLTILLLVGVALMFAAFVCSCSHKELTAGLSTSDMSDVTVTFDWSSCPDATVQTVRLTLFPTDQTVKPLEYETPSLQGLTVHVPVGSYSLLAYNAGTETLLVRGDSPEDCEIYTRTTRMETLSAMFSSTRNVPRAPHTDAMDVVLQPEHCWTSYSQPVSAEAGTAAFTLAMAEATQRYTFTIRGVQNLSYVTGLSATLSGMSASYLPALGQCSDTYAIIPFDMTVCADDDGDYIQGTLLAFGHHPGTEHYLVVYAQLQDGSKWYYTIDVSEPLAAVTEHAAEVDIQLYGLPFPKPIANGSGLHPDIDEWNSVDIDRRL